MARSTFKVLFYLKKNNLKPDGKAPIMGRITVNGSISQFSCKLNIKPDLWDIKANKATGKSLEAQKINQKLDNIKTQIGKQYQNICNRDNFVSAEKVKNAYLGFGDEYRTFFSIADEFYESYAKRVGKDRTEGSYEQLLINRRLVEIPMSFAPEDKARMANEFMLQLAKEYMQEMGIKNTQYIIVRHHNTENEHLHIIYNRIDNDLRLISVNNDYKRNIKVCKKLKDKYNLTYGKGKDRVKREKLNSPEKVKYYIHDAIKEVLPVCKTSADLTFALQQFGIEVQYKHKRTTREIEGVSFRYGGIAFKGSQIDRKFSFSNLKKAFGKNIEEAKKQAREEQKAQQKVDIQTPPIKRNLIIKGVELTDEQQKTLENGGYTFIKGMVRNAGKGQFSAYAFLNDEKNRVFFSSENLDAFVKYGKYEMRVRDKILLEKGHMVHAKIKWYGGGFAYPHLWNPNSQKIEGIECWIYTRREFGILLRMG